MVEWGVLKTHYSTLGPKTTISRCRLSLRSICGIVDKSNRWFTLGYPVYTQYTWVSVNVGMLTFVSRKAPNAEIGWLLLGSMRCALFRLRDAYQSQDYSSLARSLFGGIHTCSMVACCCQSIVGEHPELKAKKSVISGISRDDLKCLLSVVGGDYAKLYRV